MTLLTLFHVVLISSGALVEIPARPCLVVCSTLSPSSFVFILECDALLQRTWKLLRVGVHKQMVMFPFISWFVLDRVFHLHLFQVLVHVRSA